MEIPFETPFGARQDPQFQEGLAHAQAGEWPAALKCFESLAERYPADADVLRFLEQARFKARLEKRTRVAPRRASFPWRFLLFRIVPALALIAAGVFAFTFIRDRVEPMIAGAREARALAAQVDLCRQLAGAEDLDAANTACRKVLEDDPGNAVVPPLLAELEKKENLQQLCAEAEALLAQEKWAEAREKLTDIQILFPGACNARQRIPDLTERLLNADLFRQGKEAFEAGDYISAMSAYEQLRGRSRAYEAGTIEGHLYDIYMTLGKQLVEKELPVIEELPTALDYFSKALALRPKDVAAQTEQRLISVFLSAQQAMTAGRINDAITGFAAVVDTRPGYLRGLAVNRLYDLYIRSGDQHRDAGDHGMAYRQYDLAAALPGVDSLSARARRDAVVLNLTPTPTPTVTPTPSPIPTPTAIVFPTPIPPPTPAPPLATFRGQIVFRSEQEGKEGYWVMRPDGSQRRFLGMSRSMEQQYQALTEKERFSPDGRWRAYVTIDAGRGDEFPQVYVQGTDQWGVVQTWKVTGFSANVCYDPVWAPDGSRIAFVSQVDGSDDVWVINPDGTDPWNYTKNKWEWDKRPSWSPDSQWLVFWSNREGTKQLYMIDRLGGNLKKISNGNWDEYDPIWIK